MGYGLWPTMKYSTLRAVNPCGNLGLTGATATLFSFIVSDDIPRFLVHAMVRDLALCHIRSLNDLAIKKWVCKRHPRANGRIQKSLK